MSVTESETGWVDDGFDDEDATYWTEPYRTPLQRVWRWILRDLRLAPTRR